MFLHQFKTPVHQLLVSRNAVYVVFTTGQVEKLATALSSRKEAKPGFLGEEESITYVQIVKDARLVIMVVANEVGDYLFIYIYCIYLITKGRYSVDDLMW